MSHYTLKSNSWRNLANYDVPSELAQEIERLFNKDQSFLTQFQ